MAKIAKDQSYPEVILVRSLGERDAFKQQWTAMGFSSSVGSKLILIVMLLLLTIC